jgi:anthranilate synthase component 1
MKSIPIVPESGEFCRRAGEKRLIPLSATIIADLDTPLTLFCKIFGDREEVFLFESMEGGEKWGRYSFIGFEPLALFSSRGHRVTMHGPAVIAGREEEVDNPLAAVRELLADMDAFVDPELPKFCGGAVGFLGYDTVRFLEELPDSHEPLDLPDSSFMVPGVVLVHDNVRQTVTIVCWADTREQTDLIRCYRDAVERLQHIVALLQAAVPEAVLAKRGNASAVHDFHSNMEPERFRSMVERAKEYILAGDIFQVVLSQRFHTRTDLPALSIYRALRHINPSPYLFFLKFGELIQIGSSPEILVRKEGDTIELRPIAGTRQRGRTAAEDAALEQELLADPKERAEHLMLVDLGRNDVGRIARGGSVEVRDLLTVERYSHVMHIVSGVHGAIADGRDQFDVVAACFPAGTVSGAPKIRAMEIIEELEPQRRGPYAGAIGYFGFSGSMDFCIAIRTFTMHGRDLYIQAGAGIVADSDPHMEFEETVNKSMGLRRAVELAEKRF